MCSGLRTPCPFHGPKARGPLIAELALLVPLHVGVEDAPTVF
jgi:hypothetical protein